MSSVASELLPDLSPHLTIHQPHSRGHTAIAMDLHQMDHLWAIAIVVGYGRLSTGARKSIRGLSGTQEGIEQSRTGV